MELNPYEAPRVEPPVPFWPTGHQRRKANLSVILVPCMVGGMLGTVFLSPFTRGPGDPHGQSIGTALGGLGGLVIGVILRLLADTTTKQK